MLDLSSMIQTAPPPAIPAWSLDRILTLSADAALIIGLLLNAWQLRLMRVQLRDTNNATKMNRTLDFCHRGNDLEFTLYRREVYEFLYTNPELHNLVGKIDGDGNFKAALRFVINFYEEVGIAYNRGEIDRTVIRDFYSGQIEFLYKHTSPYIQNQRATHGDGLWNQFTTMRDDIRNNPA